MPSRAWPGEWCAAHAVRAVQIELEEDGERGTRGGREGRGEDEDGSLAGATGAPGSRAVVAFTYMLHSFAAVPYAGLRASECIPYRTPLASSPQPICGSARRSRHAHISHNATCSVAIHMLYCCTVPLPRILGCRRAGARTHPVRMHDGPWPPPVLSLGQRGRFQCAGRGAFPASRRGGMDGCIQQWRCLAL